MGNDVLQVTLVRAVGANNPRYLSPFTDLGQLDDEYQRYDEEEYVCRWDRDKHIISSKREDRSNCSSFKGPVTEHLLFALHELTAYQTYEEGGDIFISLSA